MHNVAASPSLADPTRFRIEPYAGLSAFPFNWTFDMTLTNGQDGFPAGLYIPSGPSFQGDSEKRRLFRVSSPGQVNVVEDRFTSGVESVVFAKGQYGNGMLLSQPQEQKILRLQADGTLTTFTSLGTRPFGPAGIAFGADGFLYAADFTGGNILRVQPDGTSSQFASIGPERPKAVLADSSGRYGGGLIAATFSTVPDNSIFMISSDGTTVTRLATGLTGIEFLTLGPGGEFGSDLYVSLHGTNLNGDGGISTVAPDGTVTSFLTGIDGMDVVFDTSGILGGGMFVGDLDNPLGAPGNTFGKIWRVTPIPEPSSLFLVSAGLITLLGYKGRKRVFV
jgi:hypothetical protein